MPIPASCFTVTSHYSPHRRQLRVLRSVRRAATRADPKVCGGMAEWSKAHAWRACRRVTVSRVRIPLPPPERSINILIYKYFLKMRKFHPCFYPCFISEHFIAPVTMRENSKCSYGGHVRNQFHRSHVRLRGRASMGGFRCQVSLLCRKRPCPTCRGRTTAGLLCSTRGY